MNAETVKSREEKSAEPTLSEIRYETLSGSIFLSGMQALVRLPIDQMRRDAKRGLRTKAFVTGFPGSPLGGYDIALDQAKGTLGKYGISHVRGQNEELAATALIGTQMLDQHPHPDVDGVVGFWYGKGPGVDRSSDAFKHGNFGGTSEHGAVVILSGEDHEAKSSSVPYQQEFAFEHYGVPVLYPATIAEFLTFGKHAIEMSRYSGCWVALKLVAPLCDGGEIVNLDESEPEIVLPELLINGRPFTKTANHTFFPVLNVATEQQLYDERHLAVAAYAEANRLNQIVLSGENDRIGVLAAGKSFADARQALKDLGYSDEQLRAAGIRIGKVGLLAPSSPEFFRQFAAGLDKIIIVEEKRDFLERQVAAAICEIGPIKVVGKKGSDGAALFPVAGGFDKDLVANRLSRELSGDLALPQAALVLEARTGAIQRADVPPLPRRVPNYCSGCPHNVSTKLAPGQMAWGAPGCHVFAALMEQPERRIEAMTQFGGEGMPWIGLSPYTSRKHIVQNVGDGSLFHSSLQNIRFAIATKQQMTFRILFNGVIANTGGQESVNREPIIELLNRFDTDGVVKTVLVARDTEDYAHLKLPKTTVLREPHQVQESMAELEKIEGVTVLIYDGACANERRRRQKRGRVPMPTKFTIVNEDVCENCGDCGRKANCMSLQKVETRFGPKTQIHQSSCNQDRSCVEGECPSFVSITVDQGSGVARPQMPSFPADLPEPERKPLERPYNVYIPGVGGTGVLTINAILAQAAAFDGLQVKSYDQTGAAQKWGAVLSSLILAPAGQPIGSNKIGIGSADLYLALDIMAATDKTNLMACSPDRTIAVANSDVLPTGEMIRNVKLVVEPGKMVDVIGARTDRSKLRSLPARTAAERIFGDYMMANMIVIGAAYQAGLLPISAKNMERSIQLNGAAVKANIQAFRLGRLSVLEPERFTGMLADDATTLADRTMTASRLRQQGNAPALSGIMAVMPSLPADLKDEIQVLAGDLIAYQNARYARKYAAALENFMVATRGLPSERSLELTALAARNLHKIMAYKDEYEVGRLLTDPVFQERVKAQFPGFRSMAFNLQPPFARAFGLKRKIEISDRFSFLLKILVAMRGLRGTPFDPFLGNAARREEKNLVAWYLDVLQQVGAGLGGGAPGLVDALLALPAEIRGYEDIKMESAAAARKKAEELLPQLRHPKTSA